MVEGTCDVFTTRRTEVLTPDGFSGLNRPLTEAAFVTIMIVIMMVNIADAKAKLSELVEAASKGEHVIICNRNEPVAELRALETAPKTPRDLAPLYPDWTVDSAFFEPLDSGELEAWYGATVHSRRISEPRPTYSSRGRRRRPRR